jgi:hypothetical protein
LGSHCSILIFHCGEFQSIWRPLSSGLNYLGLQSSSGAYHLVGISDLQRLRGILEIQAPRLFLPSLDLLFGIFIEVIGHLWHQGRIVEELQLSSRAWHLRAMRGLALGIGLHLLSSLWRIILYCQEHFVAAHTCYPLSMILAIC